MKVRDLPQADQDRIREFLPEDWDVIAGLELEELVLYGQAKSEDAEATAARHRRRSDVQHEINELVRPLVAKVGDLPLGKLAWFLHGAQRARYEELMRELTEMSRPVKVTRGREPWHEAVEAAIPDGPLLCASVERVRADLDRVVAGIMRRNADWPADRVRRFAQYRLETATGIELDIELD